MVLRGLVAFPAGALTSEAHAPDKGQRDQTRPSGSLTPLQLGNC